MLGVGASNKRPQASFFLLGSPTTTSWGATEISAPPYRGGRTGEGHADAKPSARRPGPS